ncbi:SAM-dependent methyltransferase, partial [Klebsiella pneumoniae]
MATDVGGTGTGIDVDRPNAARMYDYYLGGAFNFAADRALAEQAMQVMPW